MLLTTRFATRSTFAALLLMAGFSSRALGQNCTAGGACQISCPGSTNTTLSGTVYAPNGIDPLPNVTVYVPSAAVDAFTPGVSCPVQGAPPSGLPITGATTGADGKFSIPNVPVGPNVPLVIVSGRWRRQFVISTVNSCVDNPVTDIRFAKNQSEGDIPKIAIATGSADQVECVLRKVGIDDSEFTDASGNGRINFFRGDGNANSGGAVIDSSTPKESALMGASDPSNATLRQYDVLMLPCEGGAFTRSAQQLANLVDFANNGGRVYSSHYAYSWMITNKPFDQVVNWTGSSDSYPDGYATVSTDFTEGRTLADWLQLVGATTTKGQMLVQTVRHDFSKVNSPTQTWLTLNSSKTVMQFVFDTPVNQTTNQCGRVLFNEYHVENGSSSAGSTFPKECGTGSMTPQEKLLEFSLFELTDNGAAATLSPATQDFGSVPIGFTSDPQTFTFTNNSTFSTNVSVAPASGDFAVTGTTCSGTLNGGASCTVTVIFKPTALGARAGSLSVSAGAQSVSSSLTGTGIPAFMISPTALTLGNTDVGFTVTQTITVTSLAPQTLPFPALVMTGDYSQTNNCGASVAAYGTCTITVSFKPTTTGTRAGTLASADTSAVYSGIAAIFTGNGVDFTIAVSPTSGTTVAGYGSTTTALVTPIAGFANSVTLTCTSNATASTCVPQLVTFTPTAAVQTKVAITTISKFTVVGYTAMGPGWLAVITLGSGIMLWRKRRGAGVLLRSGLVLCFVVASSVLTVGCSGKLPAQNASYTAAGDYTYTVTGTDGFLVHSATYTLHVTDK